MRRLPTLVERAKLGNAQLGLWMIRMDGFAAIQHLFGDIMFRRAHDLRI